jgi:type IV pilus biogenesis protein CpaD/CtpE
MRMSDVSGRNGATRRKKGSVMRLTFGRSAAICLLLGTASCGPEYDPLTREGLWQPGHTNHNNLTMQVANPGDLVRGSGTTGGDGQLAAAAVDRLRNDKVKKLPASDISQITTSSSGDNNSTSGGQ